MIPYSGMTIEQLRPSWGLSGRASMIMVGPERLDSDIGRKFGLPGDKPTA